VGNFFYTLPNFDTPLAPFIGHDNLSFDHVKQALQEFVFDIDARAGV
jgi:ribonucleoside-triphosphate reductase